MATQPRSLLHQCISSIAATFQSLPHDMRLHFLKQTYNRRRYREFCIFWSGHIMLIDLMIEEFSGIEHETLKLKHSMDMLNAITPEELFSLLSIKNSSGTPFIHTLIIYCRDSAVKGKEQLLTLVVKRLPFSVLKTLLESTDSSEESACLLLLKDVKYGRGNDGCWDENVGQSGMYFSNPRKKSFEETCIGAIYKLLSRTDLYDLLTIVDKSWYSSPILVRINSGKLLKIILEAFEKRERFELLQMRSERDGTTVLGVLSHKETESEVIEEILNLLDKRDLMPLLWTMDYETGKCLLDDLFRHTELVKFVAENLQQRGTGLERFAFHESLYRAPSVILALLKTMESDKSRLDFVSAQDSSGNNILHCIRIPKFSPDITTFCDICKLLPETNRKEVLMMQNNLGNTPLYEISLWLLAVRELFSSSDFADILAVRNLCGDTVLHQHEDDYLGFLLDKLKLPPTHRVFRIQNKSGYTLFHNLAGKDERNAVEVRISWILKMVAPEIRLPVLAVKDNDGNAVVHMLHYERSEYISELMDLFDHSQDDLCQLLTVPDRKGTAPIHLLVKHHRTFRNVLSRISSPKTAKLFSCQNMNGQTPLHLAIAMSPPTVDFILQHLPQGNIQDVLAIKDKQGSTVVHASISQRQNKVMDCIRKYVSGETLLKVLSINLNFTELKTAINDNNQNWMRHNFAPLSFQSRYLMNFMPNKTLKSVVKELNDRHIDESEKFITRSSPADIQRDSRRLTELRFNDEGSIIHILAERGDSQRISKLLQALDADQRQYIMSIKDIRGRTAVEVTRSYVVREQLMWSVGQEGFYYLPTPPVVLIMYSTEDRQGAEDERLRLSEVLPDFNVQTRERSNLRKQQMLDEIRLAQMNDDISALMVIIMSHGQQGAVTASDGDLSIQDILRQMCVPFLEGKPKVLLIQACQSRDEALPSGTRAGIDPTPSISQPRSTGQAMGLAPPAQPQRSGYTLENRDMIAMTASVSGDVAYRNQMIPLFASELRDSSENGDIYEIFLKTHGRLRDKLKGTMAENQIPEFRSTLTQKLCLRNIFKQP